VTTPANYWKIGLLVVTSFVVAMIVVLWLGAQSLRRDTVNYRSFFDESVQGLEIGSPVKFRGVTIGNVSLIDVAPDRRHVDVTLELVTKTIRSMGLANADRKTTMKVPEDMRAQITSAGITGVKFIQIDYFAAKEYPAPTLPFNLPDNYIPAAPSTMKNLEDSVVKTVNQFPDLAGEVLRLLNRTNHMLEDLEKDNIGGKAAATLDKVGAVLGEVQSRVAAIDTAKLSRGTDDVLVQLTGTLKRLDTMLANLESQKGLLTTVQHTSESLGEVARSARGVAPRMDEALKEVRDAAASVRRLADALEQDPDMLIKGRATRRAP
jgi:ABC-type transporter Mla subunit MlaD